MRRTPHFPAAIAFLVASASACGTESGLGGPLGAIADTAMSYGLECAEVDHWPMTSAESPFLDCRGAVSDTSILVVSDASKNAIVVVRRWAPGMNSSSEYNDVLLTLQQSYGEGVPIPPPMPDHPRWRRTVWTFDGYYLRLWVRPVEKMMDMQWELGAPKY